MIDVHQQWVTDGCVIVRSLFDPARTADLRAICDRILAQWRENSPETGKPGGTEDATVMRHLNHSGYFAARPGELTMLMDAVADDKVLGVMRSIFGEEPLFRCTSYFFNPLGASKDGNWHRDSQFTTPNDEAEQAVLTKAAEAGNSVQMQIALVPSSDIEVVPGSHLRWDTPEEYAIRKADGGANNRANQMPGAMRVELAPGDAVLFNPMAIHRGRYHTDRLRRTLMLTYTRSSQPYIDYFSTQPWFLGDGYVDALSPHARPFFDRFIAMYQSQWQANAA
ncbi:MAG: phytanoyl-CoA dioxygenase family protein [Caldilineaceae bacterium]|nr:phytanoyl-CoA dioxygenase family protein [Caldilineaceae bacterium]